MTRSEILYSIANKIEVLLTHQCKTENGFAESERFKIFEVIGNFEQLNIVNQYGMEYVINSNQLEK